MNLTALPAFTDNSIWLLDDRARAIVVDPGESGPAAGAPDARRLELAAILVTHHRADCGAVAGGLGHTAGHIGFLGRTDADGSAAGRGARLADLEFAHAVGPAKRDRVRHTEHCQPLRADDALVAAALRTWKNELR